MPFNVVEHLFHPHSHHRLVAISSVPPKDTPSYQTCARVWGVSTCTSIPGDSSSGYRHNSRSPWYTKEILGDEERQGIRQTTTVRGSTISSAKGPIAPAKFLRSFKTPLPPHVLPPEPQRNTRTGLPRKQHGRYG